MYCRPEPVVTGLADWASESSVTMADPMMASAKADAMMRPERNAGIGGFSGE
jgi:hypothetical protein